MWLWVLRKDGTWQTYGGKADSQVGAGLLVDGDERILRCAKKCKSNREKSSVKHLAKGTYSGKVDKYCA